MIWTVITVVLFGLALIGLMTVIDVILKSGETKYTVEDSINDAWEDFEP